MTETQASAWFTYHAPTDITAPKYTAIRLAEAECLHNLDHVAAWFAGGQGDGKHAMYNLVNGSCRRFAETVAGDLPAGRDIMRAIDAIRLARNAANEGIATGNIGRLFALARTYLQEARWIANGAIACDGI